MWRRVSCEQLLHKSQSILSPRRNPKRWVAVNLTVVGTIWAKGNPVPIPEPGSGTVPNRALIEDSSGQPEKTRRRRREIRGELSLLYKRSSSLESSSREIGFGTRRAPQLRRCPNLPHGP